MTHARRLLIVDGHPDENPDRFVHALAKSYADGAVAGGHEVRRLAIAEMDIPILRARKGWETESAPADIHHAQDCIAWAEHLVILYPLWLGDMPALLKAFFEQVVRPGFAFEESPHGLPRKKLKGRTARVIVTMGMPAFFYRAYYGAHSVRSLERNILRLVGIRPTGRDLIGNVEGAAQDRADWIEKLFNLGEDGV